MTNTTIETMQQFEALPEGTVINLRRSNSATIRWAQNRAGYWTDPTSNEEVASRFFRGAIDAGFISIGEPDAGGGWEVGAWFKTIDDNGYRYLATNTDVSGAVHNCLQVSNYRVERGLLTEQSLRDSYERVDTPSGGDAGGWFGDMLTAVIPKPAVPKDLVTGLVTYAGKVDDNELFDLLDGSGVDTAPRTTVTVTGETVIDASTLNTQVGATALLTEVRVPWTKVIEEVRVKRGCLCDESWDNAVLDVAAVVSAKPVGHDPESLTYDVACPVHANK